LLLLAKKNEIINYSIVLPRIIKTDNGYEKDTKEYLLESFTIDNRFLSMSQNNSESHKKNEILFILIVNII